MRRLAVVGAMALSLLAGCAAGPHTRAGGAVSPLAVQAVAWNAAGADVGPVKAVADAGRVVAVFGPSGATVLSSGAVVARDASVREWIAAEAVRGADGAATWIVGVDGAGRLHYVRGQSALEDVTARYGLGGRRVRAVAALDARRVGFLVDGEVAVADGARVARFGAPGIATLAGGGGLGAGVARDAVTLFDAAMGARTYPLRGATAAVVGSGGRLYATTSRALYAASPAGDLALLYDAGGDTLHGLAASGDRVWFADGSELGAVDGDRVEETTGLHLARDAALAPSPAGDVWVLAAGHLERYARAAVVPTVDVRWSASIAPVFARACAACHQPGGASGVDLSTATAWTQGREAIGDRVVKTRTMPPEGHPLSAEDRAAIEAWVGRPSRPQRVDPHLGPSDPDGVQRPVRADGR